MPSVLVVVPVYGHFRYAARCVDSLLEVHSADDPELHILVLDDASPDGDMVEYANENHNGWQGAPVTVKRFPKNEGLTRSWNHGLQLAKEHKIDYAVMGNSDLIFTRGWLGPLVDALQTYSLVGPVSNACGWNNPKTQAVTSYVDFEFNDSQDYLDQTAARLRQLNKPPQQMRSVNGFCMMAKTLEWWKHRFQNQDLVFDPRIPLAGNEDELQRRWREPKAIVPSSFVFHYRSVTRGESFARGTWGRMKDEA